MSVFIVKVITTGQNVLFYTGRAGQGWVSEDITEAFECSVRGAVRKVEELQRMYAGVGLRFEATAKEGRAEAERKQQRDCDLVRANRHVQAMRAAVAEYEREYSGSPDDLPAGYFRALQSLEEWESKVTQLRLQA